MGVRIRRAEQSDRDLVVRLLDDAFMDDPVSGWVFPGEEYRRARHAGLMGVFTDATLADGYIDLVDDSAAVALWMEMPDEPHQAHEPHDSHEANASDEVDGSPESAELAALAEKELAEQAAAVRAAVDPDNERVEQIARLTAGIHPVGRAHVYLWMIGVVPGRQGEGLGTALMAPVLERCDREGLPVYLEASNPRSRALYERLGFVCTGTALDLPDGPTLWPMWREPHTS
ncbi:GNAT family N-acetyltransferase [Streptomyces sp. Q6]|uniref:GNAT family N-acetyltransferase n=1 Tax=Streptomyces citrinus TaxID=3118173 RepID=A0ACD5AH12_9ACTN